MTRVDEAVLVPYASSIASISSGMRSARASETSVCSTTSVRYHGREPPRVTPMTYEPGVRSSI